MRRSTFFLGSLAGVFAVAASLSLFVSTRHSTARKSPVAAAAAAPLLQAALPARTARIPLRFEPNQGQAAPDVKYLVRGPRYTLFLTTTDAVLHIAAPAPVSTSPQPLTSRDGIVRNVPGPSAVSTVRLHLAGANASPLILPAGRQPGVSNYYVGNDPAQWRTGIANYSRVAYSRVYPGINLLYYGNQGRLEHDFVVAPGANPSAIRMTVSGVRGLHKDASGNVVLRTAAGDIRLDKPIAYQGEGSRRNPVAAAYRILGHSLSFRLGSYDSSRALVIDPTLTYSTYLGGSGTDFATCISTDAAGDIFVSGVTQSANFPVTSGSYQGIEDAFVTKLSNDGQTLLYSVYLGGSRLDAAVAVAVDSTGDAYVTGDTHSTNFPVTAGAFQPKLAGYRNGFVTKFDPNGLILYSTYYGGSGTDDSNGIGLDSAGNAIIAGETTSTDLPLLNPIQATFGGKTDAFVASLNSTGTALNYATYLGGSNVDDGFGLAVDSTGNAYAVGSTLSSDFPTSAGAFETSAPGGGDGWVVKISPVGAEIYSTYLGGTGSDGAVGVGADTFGNAYVTGYTKSANFPTRHPFQAKNAGKKDAFVTELTSKGKSLVFSTFLGGGQNDDGQAIYVSSSGATYVAGCTTSLNFPTMVPVQAAYAGGTKFGDAFIAKLAAGGASLDFSTFLGGSGDDAAYGITVDTNGNIWIAGPTNSSDFPTANPYQAANAGGYDAFVSEISQ